MIVFFSNEWHDRIFPPLIVDVVVAAAAVAVAAAAAVGLDGFAGTTHQTPPPLLFTHSLLLQSLLNRFRANVDMELKVDFPPKCL